MHLKDIQERIRQFDEERGWQKFPASQVFAHLIEELGEISRHITVEEGYKLIGLGHEAVNSDEISREFAQVFSLFAQLANHFNVDVEESILHELEIMENRFPAKEWAEEMNKR